MNCLEVEIINLKSGHLLKFRQVILSLYVSVSLMNYNPLSGSRETIEIHLKSTSIKECKGCRKSSNVVPTFVIVILSAI